MSYIITPSPGAALGGVPAGSLPVGTYATITESHTTLAEVGYHVLATFDGVVYLELAQVVPVTEALDLVVPIPVGESLTIKRTV